MSMSNYKFCEFVFDFVELVNLLNAACIATNSECFNI